MLLDLQLTRFSDELRTKTSAGKRWIWDTVRQKWLVLQPEELVRQLLVQYLLLEKGVSKNRLAIERGLTVNDLQKRCDILVYSSAMEPWLLVECKAPQVRLSPATFRQITIYNRPLQVPFLLVSNGPESYCAHIHLADGTFTFLEGVPDFPAG
ncbi:MAG: type I restriction enzyme HsdR N-terminal domain-containing protein [Lewinella sp.]|nr:type I restriction enzyme HsdR N-terminal domain-containing protein [Lewinella sp.]